MSDIRISVSNTAADGGTALTPFWFASHDEGFEVYSLGDAASAGLEALAEDGNFDPINAEVVAFDSDAVTGAVLGDLGPIVAGETTSVTLDLDGSANAYLSVAAMILPSNDAFVGTGEAIQIFDEYGDFLGAQTLTFAGSNVLDAGTEVNTEEDAAFLNQTAPNTGVDENGVVAEHVGFLPEGDGNILGGTNALGEFIDPVAADFTQPGAQIAEVHINEFVVTDGSDDGERFRGSSVDDLVSGNGGRDVLLGRSGWDELNGGDGNDIVKGGRGNDIVTGGAGNDRLVGGRDNDVFVFGEGDERDRIVDFNVEEDSILLAVEGVSSVEDLQSLASGNEYKTVLNFGDGDKLVLNDVGVDQLSLIDFDFA